MRFVVPDTRRIDLKDSTDEKGQVVKNWIEIKKELTKGEAAQMRSAGLKRMSQGRDEKETAIDVDWKALGLGRVMTYLVDWSAKDGNGKDIKVTPQAIAELCEEDFDEIDDAIKAHITEQEEAKKPKTVKPQTLTT